MPIFELPGPSLLQILEKVLGRLSWIQLKLQTELRPDVRERVLASAPGSRCPWFLRSPVTSWIGSPRLCRNRRDDRTRVRFIISAMHTRIYVHIINRVSRIASFNSDKLKNLWWRSTARIQRCAT